MLVSIVSGLLRGELGLRGKRSIYGGEDARRRDGGMEFWRNKDQQLKLLPKSKLFTGIAKFSNRKYELV